MPEIDVFRETAYNGPVSAQNITTTGTVSAGTVSSTFIGFAGVSTVADDAAAAAAGIPVGYFYANVGVVQVRRV